MPDNEDTSTLRTRRSILLAAAGGAAAVAVTTLAHPAATFAADGDNVILGQENTAEHATGVVRDPAPDDAIALYGISAGGVGVLGESTTGEGLLGRSHSGNGVQGYSQTNAGLFGNGPLGAWISGDEEGVHGISPAGIAVVAVTETGYALRAIGRVKLDKCAGKATIASGTSSVVVTPGIDLTSASAVVATLNGNAGGSTTVKRVAINTTANTFTIHLTANATANVKAAWLVLG